MTELPGSLGFFFSPSATLQIPQPYAHALIRQYALLLATTIGIAAIFLFQPATRTSRYIAGSFAFYHLGPIARAMNRLWIGKQGDAGKGMANPWIHLIVHFICAVVLAQELLQ